MVSPLRATLSFALSALLGGCYHATVTTGLTPSTVTIEKPFASSWVYGLVPPDPVETAEQCPAGVAKVETRLSFLNQLVNFLTIGIYTPMEIKVTCAARTSADAARLDPAFFVALSEGQQALREAFEAAARNSAASGAPVYVSLRPGPAR
ncbi:MAG: Bor family protein [Gemmatimonadales bacterium]|nr:Bor family protein [Gemmatimonadales bacterium]